MSIPWKVAFDEEFAAFSPGKQLMCDETRRWLADPTIERVDPVCEEDNPMMQLLWPDREPYGTLLLSSSAWGVAARLRAGLSDLKSEGKAQAKRLLRPAAGADEAGRKSGFRGLLPGRRPLVLTIQSCARPAALLRRLIRRIDALPSFEERTQGAGHGREEASAEARAQGRASRRSAGGELSGERSGIARAAGRRDRRRGGGASARRRAYHRRRAARLLPGRLAAD